MVKKVANEPYVNREVSWLSFNDRVLQEANDVKVPLLERVKFLGIFSSNLDEFFRVRVASLKRYADFGVVNRKIIGGQPKKILARIQEIVLEQRHKFDEIYKKVLEELAKEDIHIVDEKKLNREQGRFVRSYFQQKVRPTLVPIMLDSAPVFPMLKDNMFYLAIKLSVTESPSKRKYAIIEVPTDVVSRFLVLPSKNDSKYVILLDDIIRYCLDEIFAFFEFDSAEAYTIKLTRDAEIDMEEDGGSGSFLNKITRGLKQRKKGRLVRLIYDENIAPDLQKYLMKKLELTMGDNIIPGSRYHNFKDFMDFPKLGRPELKYEEKLPMPHKDISPMLNLFSNIARKDILLQFPYHPFDYMIDLLREAAIDPDVLSIKITLYRVAENSNIVNALINAIKNGKNVTAVIELQARFDEEANIFWANRMREEGAKIIFGVPGMKVHSKLCHISRREKNKTVQYAYIATGNFNEGTAKLYSDHALLTADQRITSEVQKVFSFLDNNDKAGIYSHLLVSPFFMRNRLLGLVDSEIKNAKAGKEAWILIKLNSLVDEEMIHKLYEANKAGVQIRMVIRGQCSLKTGVVGISNNIEVVSIVDRYLEHSRIFIFNSNGEEKTFISSGDWMTRNLDHRVEVACPIYDEDVKRELKEFLHLQLSDNVKARIIDTEQTNIYKGEGNTSPVHAQEDMYNILLKHKMEKRDEPVKKNLLRGKRLAKRM